MWLIDELVEKHIRKAQEDGVFDNLSGTGSPLILDDDSGVPQELRTTYRLLKNAGYLPVELQERKDALQLTDFLKTVSRDSSEYEDISRRLRMLEVSLQQKGVNTDFLHQEYKIQLNKKF
ncbi:DUF1992 domain-containing protein [Pectobacterium aroidearum]|uniref:DUF1992 domain-containing protein n=2 Tax=Pectobacterium aroidearum TaxID=1201031 RepID=A0ABR5ZJW1_9GAMM|nr:MULTISPECIES: DUF1992 domain-containing protein [Pectobacterium]MBA5202014.1 DUF1992 domain-containing protein [Pectobacterium aroidearum]MBA5230450.1 DUF1992 domain-containing protein [Pectobacterium aroidearum]MBA5234868.1 DUF1992 domain-containing protein [Pectobacterium aroidearum]MBA5740062.1 DUF1992 domain-containing protein [Pectobacterium aroidearum]MBG0751051.1 protein yhdN [Pectobacterium carotovorum subsp. carotovorum PCCS1]